MTTGSGAEARDKLYRDRIEAMTLDNQSLQRRLNQVSSEMERINRENEDIARQINMTQGDVYNMDLLVNNKDDVDAQNHIMQADLERIKMANLELGNYLKEEEIDTANVCTNLNHITANKKNCQIENESMNHDFNYKIRQFDDISREKAANYQKLSNVNIELERLNRQELQLGHDNIDLETHVSRLQGERRELLSNIERVTINYDTVVRELGHERRNMDSNNDWHTKLIVCKNIFQYLEFLTKVRKQRVFSDLAQYCEFDRNCHIKLKNFANVAQKLGEYKQKIGLNQWYDKALKPLGTRIQNDDISISIDCNRLQAKVFYSWRQYQRDKMDCYHFKTNAIDRIWHRMEMDAKQEKKRALDIWKQKQGFQKHSAKCLKKIMKTRELAFMEQALYALKGYSQLLEHSCRIRVLQLDAATKIYMSQLFSQMRLILRNEKRKRHRMLNAFLKAWQDYVIYNRHLMQSNMAAIQFGHTNKNYTMQAVYNALRQHTETKKHYMMDQAVKQDMDVAIKNFESFNKNKQKSLNTSNKQRASNIVRDMLGKRIYAYFIHWHNVGVNYNQTMQTKVKDKIIKMYLAYIRSYFLGWKKKETDRVRKKKMKMVQDMQFQADQATNQALDEAKNQRVQAEAARTTQRKLVDKTFRKLFFRKLDVAVGRWKDICVQKGDQEDRAALVIKRMRTRFLRQAFDRYLAFFRNSQQHGRNENGADYMREVLTLREKRKVYFAWCYYTQWRLRIKRIWNKVLYRLDAYQKKRVIQRWNGNTHDKYQKLLMNKQADLTDIIQSYNEEIGGYQMDDHGQLSYIKDQNKVQSKVAYRQIANFFQRAYTDQTSTKFILWKQKVNIQIHKEKLIKKTIDHYNRRYLEAIQRVFLKFLSDERKKDRLVEIKATQISCNDLETKIKFNRDKQEAHREKESVLIENTTGASEETERKILHTMEVLEHRNLTLVCRSKKRMIFEMWRYVTTMEKAFCYSVKNVLEKSLFKCGFEQINWYARDEEYTRKVHRALKRFSLRSAKINHIDSFNKWKKFALSNVDSKNQDLTKELNKRVEEFEAFVNQAREVNTKRVFEYFLKNNTQNYFRGWKNVIEHFKLVKQKEIEYRQRELDLRRIFVLQKWKKRAYKTRQCHARNNQLIIQFKFKYVRSAFYGWKTQWTQDKRFFVSLSNLEKMMRVKMYSDSFKTVKTYSISKGLVQANNRKKGTQDVVSIVKQSYLKRLGAEFQKYKDQCGVNTKKDSRLKVVYSKFITIRTRDAFTWWKKKHELQELAKDLYETGPVRAQYWTANKEIDNLRDFMRKEHYTEDEIEKFHDDVCDTTAHLMNKYLIRIRIRQDENRKMLPLIWNRWREFVGVRKLVRYQFQNCHNQIQETKADVQRAFKKWRRGPDQLTDELWKLPLETITNLAMKTTKELDDCQDQISENQSINNHLVLQRDEFLNYYIKGQILAMALIKDKTHFCEMQGVSRWLLATYRMFREENRRDFEAAYYLEANLNKDEARLNEDNGNLERENGELGQFTKDGAIIKHNMLRLQAERDKVAADIAETDDDLKELLERNEELQRLVDEFEKKAAEVKAAGGNRKFKDVPLLKQKTAVEEEAPPQETSEEKKKRERMEKLAGLSSKGGLR